MITAKALTNLDQDLVDQSVAETRARLQEANPTLHLGIGVFNDYLVYYNGLLGAQTRDLINSYLRGRSLAAIQEDPTLADDDLVNDVLSNFRLTRNAGTAARGDVTVVLTDDVTVTIAQGTVWTANGRQFTTPIVYTAKAEAGQINDAGDRLYTRTADGKFAFTITLDAVEPGPEGRLTRNTLVVPATLPANYVTSYAANDFDGGTATETNQELLDRLQEGVACKAPSNRVNMRAMLRAEPAFARVVASSILGYGDPEQLRDRHWIFPVAGGGRCDWYVRTQEALAHATLAVTATLVEIGDDGYGTWQFAVGRDDAPGFYEIRNVRPRDQVAFGGFTVTSDVRANDLSGVDPAPDVVTVAEGAYSRFQAAVVRFRDTQTLALDLTVGDRAEYDAEATYLPLIADVQDFVSGRDVSHHAADVLVKAPVPCFLQLRFTVFKRTGQPDPDLDAIKAALATEVNRIGFIGRLYASQVQEVVHGFLGDDQTVSAIDLFGRIRYPGGAIEYLRDSEALIVPDDPAVMVTARTVQFFLAPEDVGITVVTAVPTIP